MRSKQNRIPLTGRAAAAVRLVRAILELDRRGIQGALSNWCPLLGTDESWFCGRDAKRFRKTPAKDLLATVEREWEILCRRTRRKRPRPTYSRDGLAAFRLFKNIRELERRGFRSASSSPCPLLGADVAQHEKAFRNRLAKASTEALLALVQREWEKVR
ncbi:MAG: hypothetical protein HY238_04860 [Acidobacteria bacterium]|nr:hypothetical protein [Acidobacteriota bacterium]